MIPSSIRDEKKVIEELAKKNATHMIPFATQPPTYACNDLGDKIICLIACTKSGGYVLEMEASTALE